MLSEVEVKLDRVLFPKDGEVKVGEYSIVSVTVEKHISGDAPKINKYGTITLISKNSPVAYNKYDTYHIKIEYRENKYGPCYYLIQVCDGADVNMSLGDKRTFLEKVLTERQIDNLYEMYDDPYELLYNKDTESLLKVSGIGKTSIKKLYKKYDEMIPYQQMMVELKEFEPSMFLMKSLLSAYGSSELAIRKVKENVYILADEVKGIGFKKADAKAMKAGISPNSPERLKAYIQYFLRARASDGHTWVPYFDIYNSLMLDLNTEFPQETISKCFTDLYKNGIVAYNEDGSRIYLTENRQLEENIYSEILRIKDASDFYAMLPEVEECIIKETEQSFGYSFTDEQIAAIRILTKNNFAILTAAAGTGKTTLIKVITSLFSAGGFSCKLCTLSGKASARIFESTGYEGATIHRTLEYDPKFGGFNRNKENPLPYDVIIVDESSFIGGELFYSLISAVKTGGKLLLIGDDRQLPAIGMCNIFHDIIQSGVIPTARLSKIHRQAQKSGIIVASQDVREGKLLFPYCWEGESIRGELQDLTLDIYNDKSVGESKILNHYANFVSCLEDAKDTQIIVPQKTRGTFSTLSLNTKIQCVLNPADPSKKEISLTKDGHSIIIREGDRVINRKNNYRATIYDGENNKNITEIFNGFCGDVINIFEGKVVVKFDIIPELILFDFETRNNLELAYALTTHLFQGSQVKNIIIGIDNGSYKMNSRELLYTAITRAVKNCVLVGESTAIYHCVKNAQVTHKNTFLKDLLQGNKL